MLKRLLIRYELLIATGLLIAILSFLNVLGVLSINSDLFWALAGVGLMIEGVMEMYFERKDDLVRIKIDQEQSEEGFKELGQRISEDPLKATVTVQHTGLGVTMSFVSFRNLLTKHIKEGENDE